MGGRFIRAMLAVLLVAPTIHAPAAAQSGKGPAVTSAFMLGRWTDTGNCQDTVNFRSDGSFVTAAGAQGRWQLDGNRLSFIGSRTIIATVTAMDDRRIRLVRDDGTTGESTRCLLSLPAAPSSVDEALRISRPVDSGSFLLGTWTDDGNCGNSVVFYGDGRFTVPSGSGRWELKDEQLSFIGNSTSTARARAVGSDRLLLIHPDGAIGQSVRC